MVNIIDWVGLNQTILGLKYVFTYTSMLISGMLKSDYFRIEIYKSLGSSAIILGLKSDYFRIEIEDNRKR